jgi:hypothetical protein
MIALFNTYTYKGLYYAHSSASVFKTQQNLMEISSQSTGITLAHFKVLWIVL